MSEVNHPKHYNVHPSGVEAIDLCEIASFNVGNAWKYLFRAGHKDGSTSDIDLQKARWYLEREYERQRAMSLSETLFSEWQILMTETAWAQYCALIQRVVDAEPDSALGVVLLAFLASKSRNVGGFETSILHMRNALNAWERLEMDRKSGEEKAEGDSTREEEREPE